MGGNCQCEQNAPAPCRGGANFTVTRLSDVEVEPTSEQVMPGAPCDMREQQVEPCGMDATPEPCPRLRLARWKPPAASRPSHSEVPSEAPSGKEVDSQMSPIEESDCMSQSTCGTAADVAETTRLLLTSNGLSTAKLKSEFRRLLGDDPGSKTAWYIPTAALAESWTQRDVRQAAAKLQASFNLGRVEIIDVEHVKGESLIKALAELGGVDVVWAEAGNTYALRHHLRTSGADDLIREALYGGALYVGSSAGSIVAGRTVQMAFWKDWDDRTAGFAINVDWDDAKLARGLDLVGGRSFFPHANGPYGSREWQDAQARKHGHTDHEVVRLRDGEAFLIEEGRVSFIS